MTITEWQCQRCGAVAPNANGSGYSDGTSPKMEASGGKAIQREVWEDRARAHNEWRRGQGFGCTCDIDLVEWTRWRGRLEPVMVLELTLVPGELEVPQSYFGNISWRFRHQAQGQMAREIARRLGVPVYIVAFRANQREFWIYEGLDLPLGRWRAYTEPEYAEWIREQYRQREAFLALRIPS